MSETPATASIPPTTRGWIPHFGIKCSCGKAELVPITEAIRTIAFRDCVAALHALPDADLNRVVTFFGEHVGMGHEPDPSLAELAPVLKGGDA